MRRPSAKVILVSTLILAAISLAIAAALLQDRPGSVRPNAEAERTAAISAESTPGATGASPGQPPTAGAPQTPDGAPPSSPGAAPQQPATPSAPPRAPAAEGEALTQVTTPPERSLWALSAEKYSEGGRITVEFEPYGTGPQAYGPSIVALVTEADTAEGLPDITGRNVVFLLGDSAVEMGGRHTGTAVARKHGDRVMFVLEGVRPAR